MVSLNGREEQVPLEPAREQRNRIQVQKRFVIGSDRGASSSQDAISKNVDLFLNEAKIPVSDKPLQELEIPVLRRQMRGDATLEEVAELSNGIQSCIRNTGSSVIFFTI